MKARNGCEPRRRTGEKAVGGRCGHDGAACRHWRLCGLKKAEACMRYAPKRNKAGSAEHCRICATEGDGCFACFRRDGGTHGNVR